MLLHLVAEFDLRRDVVPWLAARGWAAALGNAAAGGAAPAGSAAAGLPAPRGGLRRAASVPPAASVRCPLLRAEEPGLRRDAPGLARSSQAAPPAAAGGSRVMAAECPHPEQGPGERPPAPPRPGSRGTRDARPRAERRRGRSSLGRRWPWCLRPGSSVFSRNFSHAESTCARLLRPTAGLLRLLFHPVFFFFFPKRLSMPPYSPF